MYASSFESPLQLSHKSTEVAMNAVEAGLDVLFLLLLIASMSKPTDFRLLLQFFTHRRNALAARIVCWQVS